MPLPSQALLANCLANRPDHIFFSTKDAKPKIPKGAPTMTKPIYLDYNGTTPHAPEVIAAMRPFLETEFGNPSSGHAYGRKPREAVAAARRQVAALLNCRPDGSV